MAFMDMGRGTGLTLGLAYCGGLIGVSALVHELSWGNASYGAAVGLALGSGLGAALLLPRMWRRGPDAGLWLLMGLVATVAVLNYGWRQLPPPATDIGFTIGQPPTAIQHEVAGKVASLPRRTRRGASRFWLKAETVQGIGEGFVPLGKPQPVTGRLYVTADQEQAVDLGIGQAVTVKGRLYAPSPAKNPNGFDFEAYLKSQGSYAGLRAQWVNPQTDSPHSPFALWRLRQRVAQAHAASLGDTAGPLVTAMALGRKAVDLPHALQDSFVQAGLPHTLAASGFHVSLVLGVVLAVLNWPGVAIHLHRPGLIKLGVGSGVLFLYVLVTGGQPSVWRAAVMGFGALVGLALERQVRPLGCLVLAVTLLLLVNPTWIDSIGFRLSVMATLGLMMGVGPLTQRLDWLPPTLATVVAVPVAAYLWTLPLVLHHFNTMTTYSLLLNMVATPFVVVLSLGGMASALVALVAPELASVLAWPLAVPAHILIALVQWETSLPGSTIATGAISWGQMMAVYGLFAVWIGLRRGRWRAGVALAAVLVGFGPLWWGATQLSQVTILAAGNDAVMVIQERHRTMVLHNGTATTATYTLAPFLKQAGVNRINQAIALPGSTAEAWTTLASTTPIHSLHGEVSATESPESDDLAPDAATPDAPTQPLSPAAVQHHHLPLATATLPSYTLQPLGTTGMLTLTTPGHTPWLVAPTFSAAAQQQLATDTTLTTLQHPVLWWSGDALSSALLQAMQPGVAIVSGYGVDPETATWLTQHQIPIYVTEQHGAITWRPHQGYHTHLGVTTTAAIP